MPFFKRLFKKGPDLSTQATQKHLGANASGVGPKLDKKAQAFQLGKPKSDTKTTGILPKIKLHLPSSVAETRPASKNPAPEISSSLMVAIRRYDSRMVTLLLEDKACRDILNDQEQGYGARTLAYEMYRNATNGAQKNEAAAIIRCLLEYHHAKTMSYVNIPIITACMPKPVTVKERSRVVRKITEHQRVNKHTKVSVTRYLASVFVTTPIDLEMKSDAEIPSPALTLQKR